MTTHSQSPSPPPIATGLGGGWQRLHPLSALIRASRGVLLFLVLFLIGSAGTHARSSDALFRLGVLAVALVMGLVVWLVTRWRVADGCLQIETGLLRRSSLRYPLSQIQAIDIVRPGLARVLGLAELRVRMAAGGGESGRLAYLDAATAENLRARLLALAHGLTEATPAPPERLLYTVDPRRLVASLLLSGPAVIVEIAVIALVATAAASPPAAAAALSASAATLIGVTGALWRRFNGEYRLTVAEAPDGLRVRSGLVETLAETIPAGRVQALRLVQPFTWRLFGWYRLYVDVAGKGTGGRQNRAAKLAARILVPVGTVTEALTMVDRLAPGRPQELTPPPRRVRLKTPLRYFNLSAGVNEGYVAVTSGRLRRVTDWVPLAKVQSLRWVQGPLQRRLQVASVHVDTAGRSVFAVLRDRDETEAAELLSWLTEACRRERARQPSLRR